MGMSFSSFRLLLVDAVLAPDISENMQRVSEYTKLREVCDSLAEVEIQMEISDRLGLEIACEHFTATLTAGELHRLCIQQ